MKKIDVLKVNGELIDVKHTSEKYTIGWKDGLRALLIAVISPVLLAVQQSISAGELELNWQQLGLTAISAAIAYLIKNFFTPSEVVLDKSHIQ